MTGAFVHESYRRLSKRRATAIAAMALIGFMSVVVDIATGPALLRLDAVVRSVFGLAADRTVDAIVWSIRLPAALMALVVGASLGLTGAIMQTVLNNPLASSYTLGISAGAGFGAALAIVAGSALPLPEAHAIPLSAFLFAGVACVAVYGIGATRGATPEMLVLAGIACLFFFQAALALVQFVASPEALQQIVFWLFGSLTRSTWPKVGGVATVLVVALPLLFRLSWQLTALRLGDERARGLGVDLPKLRLQCFVLVSLLTGVAVAFVGTIGFVGLVAPHIARMFVGEDQRVLIPASALVGAATLSLASVVSKSIMPGSVFPIGIVTSMIGVPFFVWLIVTSKRSHW
jgi:iron complex transport system permease protein